MGRSGISFRTVTLLVVAFAAVEAVAGCVSESDPGPSLNPQPLPPQAPPDDNDRGEVRKDSTGAVGEDFEPNDGSSSGSSSSGAPDADAGQ